MGACAKISKVGLIIFNILFLAAGLAVLAAGIYFYVKANTYAVPQSFSIGTMIIAIGVIVFSTFGLIAAVLINKIMLWIYFVLLLLLLAGEIAAAVVAYKDTSNLVNFIGSEYRGLSNSSRQFIENEFDCCGFFNNTDAAAGGLCCQYVANLTAILNTTPTTPSESACVNAQTNQVNSCYQQYLSFYDTYIVYLEAGAGVLAGIEIFGMIFAMALALQADEAAKDMEMNDYS